MRLRNFVIRYILLSLLGLIGISLGYLRWTYAIIWENGFKLIPREFLESRYSYPENWTDFIESLAKDPRWISCFIYLVTPFFLSLASVYLFFQKRSYIHKTIWVYLFSWLVLSVFFLMSLIFSNYQIGIGLAQNLKHLIQTPFFSLLLIAAFKMNEIVGRKKLT